MSTSVQHQNGANQSPGSGSYNVPNPIQATYISSSQTQPANPGVQFPGQTVTYYQLPTPVVQGIPQQFVRPAQTGYIQSVEANSQNIISSTQNQGAQQPPVLPGQQAVSVQVIQPPQVIQNNQPAGQYTENRTTTSTYTYNQFPSSSQYVPQGSGQYVQNVQYVRPPVSSFQGETGDRAKSNMELTLEKID